MDHGRVAASTSGRPRDGVGPPPDFPAGLRVLLVDDDATCLKVVDRMLRTCLYDVTTCSRAAVALAMLRERKGAFDLVLSDVYMPDMDGFKLLEHIGLEMDLPVIMMSADDGRDVVMKGVTHGACDYLIKPVSMEALRNIWQHVVRKRRNELKELEHSGSAAEENDRQKRALEDGDNASSASEVNWKNVKRRKDGKEEEEEVEEREDPSTVKKPRVVWSVDLHQQFVAAVNQLGVDKAVPKKILELMNVPGLTRENVASHLQKYRLYLRRLSVPQHQARFDTPYTGTSEATFNSVTSFDGLVIQSLAVAGQFPPQSLTTLHSQPRRVATTGIGLSSVGQIGFNSSAQMADASNTRPAMMQQMNDKKLNFLSGPSRSMDSGQLGQSQLVQSYGNMGLRVSEGASDFYNLPSSQRTSTSFSGGTINANLSNSLITQMTQQGPQFSVSQQQNQIHTSMRQQPQTRRQLLNGIAGEHDSRLSTTMGHQILSNVVPGHVSGRGGSNMNLCTSLPECYINASSYGTVSHALHADFPNSYMNESTGSSYPLATGAGATNFTPAGMLQEAFPPAGNVEALGNSTSLKGAKDFGPEYDLLNEVPQNKSQDWKLQNINVSYHSAKQLGSTQSNIDPGSSLLANQDSIATIKDDSSRSTCTVKKEIFSVRTENEYVKGEYIAQGNNTILVDNSVRVKAEGMSDLSYQDVLFDDDIIQNELMNIVGKQEEGVGQVGLEFNFDGYSLDDIQV